MDIINTQSYICSEELETFTINNENIPYDKFSTNFIYKTFLKHICIEPKCVIYWKNKGFDINWKVKWVKFFEYCKIAKSIDINIEM